MLAHGTEISTVPYLWTAMFGKSIRYAGEGFPGAAVDSVPGELFWVTEIMATFQGHFKPLSWPRMMCRDISSLVRHEGPCGQGRPP